MTHEIEVRVKIEGVVGEITFYVSDMPHVETSVRKNLANFDNWQYAKWIEDGVFHCIESVPFQSIMQKGIEMISKKGALPELTNLALIDRILVSVDNLVWARSKGIALTPEVELGNLKQITECGIALREVLLKEDTFKRMGYYLQPAKGESR